MKKAIVTALAAMMLVCSLALPAAAEAPAPQGDTSTAQPRAEELVWKYRYGPKGQLQKRLWSETYQCWRSEWMDVDP